MTEYMNELTTLLNRFWGHLYFIHLETEIETSTKVCLTPEHITAIFKWPLGNIKIIMALGKGLKFPGVLNVNTLFKSRYPLNLDQD